MLQLNIELSHFTEILRMLFTGVMVMTMMAIACGLSFLEVEGEEAAAVVVAAVGEWDPRGPGMVPPPDAQSTEFLCQVGYVSLHLYILCFCLNYIDRLLSLTKCFSVRSSSQWKLAGSEGSHARSR